MIGNSMNSCRSRKGLRQAAFAGLLIVLQAAALCTADEMERSNPPRLEIGTTVIDLGKVQEGEVLAACFDLRNTGKGPLRILRVQSGCSCTRVDHPAEVASGGQGEICLSIDTFGIHGARKFKVGVYSNDPSRPAVTLQARARIAPLVTLTPDRVFLKDAAGQALRQEIYIETQAKEPLQLQIVSHDLGNKVAVHLQPVVEGKRYRLSVENRVNVAGSYRGRIHLQSDHPGREHIVVPVFVCLTPPVAVYPPRLVLDTGRCPACRAAGRFSGTLIVRAHDQKPLQIIAIGPEQAGLSWTIQTLIPDEAYRVAIDYSAANGPSPPPEMKIQVNRVDYGPLVVPVQLGP